MQLAILFVFGVISVAALPEGKSLVTLPIALAVTRFLR